MQDQAICRSASSCGKESQILIVIPGPPQLFAAESGIGVFSRLDSRLRGNDEMAG